MTVSAKRWKIEPLDRKIHVRKNFVCGAPALDNYIREVASQDEKRDVARVFVVCDENSDVVVGFYSLSATSVQYGLMPPDKTINLPKYPVPGALLGRLAVDKEHQNKRLGTALIYDAFDKTRNASKFLAIQSLFVDAKDNDAANFYRRLDFRNLLEKEYSLFLPVNRFPESD